MKRAARTRAKIMEGFARAERKLFTRPAPKSARAQMKFFRTREKGSTKSLAARLGVSRKTVQRYLSGASTKPNKRLQEALVQETESEWQPQVRAQARQRAASSGGLIISCRAYFGFGPEGTSDAGRVRDISVAVSSSHAGDCKTFGVTPDHGRC
ncbi:MAG TPA: terminal protein, partial [Streptomyces sp.]|nr:terminal protein [Streptomyces sp.]